MARKLILKPRGQGLNTVAAYVAYINKVTGTGLPEASMLPEELHFKGNAGLIQRNALLRKERYSGPVISKESISHIVKALPNEASVAIVSDNHLLGSWVAAYGKKCKVLYPKTDGQLTHLTFTGGRGQDILKYKAVSDSFVEKEFKKFQGEHPQALVEANEVLSQMPSSRIRRILTASGPGCVALNSRIFALDAATAALSDEDLSFRYSFIGQTMVNHTPIKESTLQEDGVVKGIGRTSALVSDSLLAIVAKDALAPGSGKEYALKLNEGILKVLDNGDKVYVQNLEITYTKLLTESKVLGEYKDTAASADNTPTNRIINAGLIEHSRPHNIGDPRLGVAISAIPGTEQDVEGIVSRILSRIPALNNTSRDIFGSPVAAEGTSDEKVLVRHAGRMVDLSYVTDTPRVVASTRAAAFEQGLSSIHAAVPEGIAHAYEILLEVQLRCDHVTATRHLDSMGSVATGAHFEATFVMQKAVDSIVANKQVFGASQALISSTRKEILDKCDAILAELADPAEPSMPPQRTAPYTHKPDVLDEYEHQLAFLREELCDDDRAWGQTLLSDVLIMLPFDLEQDAAIQIIDAAASSIADSEGSPRHEVSTIVRAETREAIERSINREEIIARLDPPLNFGGV